MFHSSEKFFFSKKFNEPHPLLFLTFTSIGCCCSRVVADTVVVVAAAVVIVAVDDNVHVVLAAVIAHAVVVVVAAAAAVVIVAVDDDIHVVIAAVVANAVAAAATYTEVSVPPTQATVYNWSSSVIDLVTLFRFIPSIPVLSQLDSIKNWTQSYSNFLA